MSDQLARRDDSVGVKQMSIEELKEIIDGEQNEGAPMIEFSVADEVSYFNLLKCKLLGGHVVTKIDGGTFAPRIQQCVKCGYIIGGGELNRRRWASDEELKDATRETGKCNHVGGPF